MTEHPPDPENDPRAAPPTSDGAPAPARTMHWGVVVAPAVALVVGLVVGGLVVGAGNGGASPSATRTVTVSPSANPSEDTAVVVPKECVQAADTVQEALALLRDNISAIQEFRANAIIDLLNELEDLSNKANTEARTCSDITITPTSDAASPTP